MIGIEAEIIKSAKRGGVLILPVIGFQDVDLNMARLFGHRAD
jgi:hypothetical protein